MLSSLKLTLAVLTFSLTVLTGKKREFSVPRTPQQNGIAQRKNRTLIEAARTMLVDSLLPIPFLAEEVNTTCYVQNKVLVTKPHNKTLYELLLGRTPSIGFMRPFGCPVTILNTLDPLGKFDRKADEGFLVGYSMSSKAFRVFNSRTRIVQETLHINFLENKPNVAGSGPTWLFDIDTLIKSMNYQPVTAGNQPNPNAGIQEQFDAEKAGEENVQQYVLFPLWSSSSKDPQNTDNDDTFEVKEHEFEGKKPEFEVHVSLSNNAKTKKHDDKTTKEAKGKSPGKFSTRFQNLNDEFEDFFDNNINEVNAAGTSVPAVGQISTNSTNTFIADGPSNTDVSLTHGKSSYVDTSQYADDLNTPALEDITYSGDEEDVSAEADFTNLETTITFSPIPTTRVHKDHPMTQTIGDLSSATQTRSMTRMVKDQGGLTQINNEDFHTCMFACFFHKKNPRGYIKLLKIQEEGIDYEEVFAPVARIEAIRFFLAYASFMGFMVYQMYVNSAFLYRTIVEEVYVYQPPEFEDPNYPDKVYKVVKALYGLHQAPRAWYETLVNYLLENGFQRGMIDQTLFIEKQKGNILLVQAYVDDIIFGSTNKDLCKAFEKLMTDKFQTSSMGELTYFLDSDYTDASLDRKSTTGGCQFLECRLISWQCKKQRVVATSSTEAEFIAAASCCPQVLWIQNQLLDYGLTMQVIQSSMKLLERIIACYNYLKCWLHHHTSNGSQFTMSNPHYELTSPDQTVSGKDSSNPSMPNNLPKIVWFSTHHVALMKSWLVQKKTALDASEGFDQILDFLNASSINSSIASAFICLSTCRKFNFTKYVFNNLLRNVDSSSKLYMYPRFSQLTIQAQVGDLSSHTTKYSSSALTQKVFANIRRVGKGFSGVKTPLFQGMLVPQQAADAVDNVVTDSVPTDDVADDDPAADAEPTPSSPPPTTTPPPP
uniref:Uncharacterized protein n=1 Tax=Tanacetum cinerariifolium TaxID=118510 RepID=A0A699GMJ5_TANCI|nr:hypothetical protein [Tanacetum cinerariifolium]